MEFSFEVGDKVRDITDECKDDNCVGYVTHVDEVNYGLRVRMVSSNNGFHEDYDKYEYWPMADFEKVLGPEGMAEVKLPHYAPQAAKDATSLPLDALVSQARARILALEAALESQAAMEMELRRLKRMVAACELNDETGAV